MRLGTVWTATGPRAGIVGEQDGQVVVELLDVGCVDEALAVGLDRLRPTGEKLVDPEWAPLVLHPSKIVCVGLNYRAHILETGRDLPEYPTLFTKFADTLCGAEANIGLPPESQQVDWEAELAVVIGRTIRRASEDGAAEAIAGFAVANDVSLRDWQKRTLMWDQGKFWDRTTPLGPWLVTPDDLPGGVRPDLAIECEVNGEVMQSSRTSDLVFDPVALVQYVSTIATLRPGDVILTGTPGGVGMAMDPQRWLAVGDELVTRIEHLGEARNRCVES